MKKTEVVKALIAMVDCFMEGRNYDTMNPHTRAEVKQACEALGCHSLDYREAKDIFIEEAEKDDSNDNIDNGVLRTIERATGETFKKDFPTIVETSFNREQWGRAGDRIANMLNIKKGKDGYYKTQWGKKTSIGFMETLVSMINEELKG